MPIINGESVSIPQELDLQYAICAALAGRAIAAKNNSENAQQVWGNILNFAKDFPQKELGVMLVSDMQRAIGAEIFAIPEFTDWAGKIANVMFDYTAMINLNKNTQYDTSPLLRLGFRPFFFASGMIAIISMLMWMVFYPSLILINNANPIDWHAHEMIFAYASAVTVGFLLTASKNWTGIQTIYNKPLLALLLLWVSGRFLPFVTHEYLVYQAVLDTSFLIFSTLAIAWPIIKAKKLE